MKKCVTLSAVALAGATLGVGTTFGWWDSDSVPKIEEPRSAEKDASSPESSVVKGIEISGPDEIRGARPQLSPAQPLFSPDADGFTRTIAQSYFLNGTTVPVQSAGISQTNVEKLKRELAKEADELEKAGHKEAAQIHRKLLSRLQRTLQNPPPGPPPSVSVRPLTFTPPPVAVAADPFGPPTELRIVHFADPLAASLQERAESLERESRIFAEQGQNELANDKRAQASRLREVLKDLPEVAVHVHPGQRPQLGIPVPLAPYVQDIHQELGQAISELSESKDPETIERLQTRIRELKTKLQAFHPAVPPRAMPTFEPTHTAAAEPRPYGPHRADVVMPRTAPGGPNQALVIELQKYAGRLRAEGHRGESRAILEQAAEIAGHSAQAGVQGDPRPVEVIPMRESDRQQHVRPVPPRTETRDVSPRDHDRRSATVENAGVHRLLLELRQEMTKLRADVREMRQALAEESKTRGAKPAADGDGRMQRGDEDLDRQLDDAVQDKPTSDRDSDKPIERKLEPTPALNSNDSKPDEDKPSLDD